MTPQQARKRMAQIRRRILSGKSSWYTEDKEWADCQKVLFPEASKKKSKRQRKIKVLRRLSPEEA